MADVAAIFHWRPQDMDRLSLAELMHWRALAVERYQEMNRHG